jgi:hypothetical protein
MHKNPHPLRIADDRMEKGGGIQTKALSPAFCSSLYNTTKAAAYTHGESVGKSTQSVPQYSYSCVFVRPRVTNTS